MLKTYKFKSQDVKQTREIAHEFARVCEALRPRDEVWEIGLIGSINVGKSTFSRAFAKSVFDINNNGLWLHKKETDKMKDFMSNKLSMQVRCGDYAAGNDRNYEAYFLKPRKEGYTGYDILEHAAEKRPYVAKIILTSSQQARDFMLIVEEKLWSAPIFLEAMKKFKAYEF